MEDIKSKTSEEKPKKAIVFELLDYVIVIGLGVLSLITPVILSAGTKYDWMGLGNTAAQIGDAIGGISAPFVGFLAAYLIYKSFEAQIKANQKQFELIEQSHKDQMIVITQELTYNFITNLSNETIAEFDTLKVVLNKKGYLGKKIIERLEPISYDFSLCIRDGYPKDHPTLLEIKLQYLALIQKLSSYTGIILLIVKKIMDSDLDNEVKIIKRKKLQSFIDDNIKTDVNRVYKKYSNYLTEELRDTTQILLTQFDYIENYRGDLFYSKL